MLHTIRLGEKSETALVFLHGFMGSAEEWRDIAEPLSCRWHSVLVDLPGHGASIDQPGEAYTWEGACRRVREIVVSTECPRVVLIGYSMGARIAIQVAIEESTGLAGLVIESGTAGLEDPDERDARRQVDRERAGELHSAPIETFVRRWYEQDLFNSLASRPELLEGIVAARAINDPLELARVITGLSVANQPSLWSRLPMLDLPTLVLTGRHDEKYEGLGDRLADTVPRSQRVTIAGCGHNVHGEDAGVFAEALEDFVESLS